MRPPHRPTTHACVRVECRGEGATSHVCPTIVIALPSRNLPHPAATPLARLSRLPRLCPAPLLAAVTDDDLAAELNMTSDDERRALRQAITRHAVMDELDHAADAPPTGDSQPPPQSGVAGDEEGRAHPRRHAAPRNRRLRTGSSDS